MMFVLNPSMTLCREKYEHYEGIGMNTVCVVQGSIGMEPIDCGGANMDIRRYCILVRARGASSHLLSPAIFFLQSNNYIFFFIFLAIKLCDVGK